MDILQDKILEYLNKNSKKIDFWTLKKKLKINGEKEENLLRNALQALEEQGRVYLDKNECYCIFDIDKLDKIQGKLFISRKGYGYVNTYDEKQGKFSYLIHPENLNGALSDDIVIISDFTKMKSNYILAKVEKIVKRNHDTVVFEYQGNGLFTPYNQKSNLTFTTQDDTSRLVFGDRILVKVNKDNLGDSKTPIFKGEILYLIGHKDDPKIDIETIAYDYGFVTNFSDEVLKELEQIPTEVKEEDLEDRRDLREELIFTIDGDDTKDIDDAISLNKESDYYILKVSIADVAHYVKPGSALFEAAKERGTSAYLADSVLPMLPHQLSNGICSLNPGVDRLAITCEMKIDGEGKVVSYDYYKSVINSKKQMTYNAVNSILEEGIIPEDYEEFTDSLQLMEELSRLLEKQKKERGSIDFASSETKMTIDDNGKPIKVEARKQRTAEKIIENFMLEANETIATNFFYMNVPFVYRIHEMPNVERLTEALEFLKSSGLIDDKKINRLLAKVNNNELHSYDIADILRRLEKQKGYIAFSNMLLRSMSKAIYAPHNEGHYGLALENYTHFTSPIRRFPDLMVHTLIREYETFENIDYIEKVLPGLCEHASFMERMADDAEKAADELKMAEYMQDHIGETFEGTVIACTRYGLVVLLDNYIKGRVDFEDILDGKYYYGTESHELVNVNDHHKNYKIGDRILVKVKEVSVPYRTVNFKSSKENIFDCKSKVKRKHIING